MNAEASLRFWVRSSIANLLREHCETTPAFYGRLFYIVMSEVHAALVEFAIGKANKHQSIAAAYLGINRNTLLKYMKASGLNPRRKSWRAM